MASIWTPERIGSAKTLYNVGSSAAECAAILSREFGFSVTRNSVVGLWHRQKFQGRKLEPDHSRSRRTYEPRRAADLSNRERVPRTIAPEPFITKTVDAVPLNLSFDDLQHGQCRYPYGDRDFTFCGCQTVPGQPYCEPHQQLCYNRNHIMSRTEWKQHQRKHKSKFQTEVVAA